MNKILLLFVSFLTFQAFTKEIVEETTLELGLSGFIELQSSAPNVAHINVSLGYFVLNGVLLGFKTQQGTDRYGQKENFFVYSEYYIIKYGMYLPYAAIDLGYVSPPRNSDTKGAKVVSLNAGVKVKIAENVAIDLQIQNTFANYPVLREESSYRKSNNSVQIALKLYY